MSLLRIYLFGASGKMGIALQEAIDRKEGYCRAESQDTADVYIDFSVPEATCTHIDCARKHKKPFVLGTTGLSEEILNYVKQASQDIPVFFSPNFSLGIVSLLPLLPSLHQQLLGYKITLSEVHHVSKKDTPSGTALALASTLPLSSPIHSERTGTVTGEHCITFTGPYDQLEIRHTALSRAAFAEGALHAARFLIGKPPALYGPLDQPD